jgi:hypothetical protein
VASPGVIHRNPWSTGEPGAQHVAGLVEEAVLAGDQQADDLAFGDDDPERPQQGQQPRHRDLALMILGEHEAAQFRSLGVPAGVASLPRFIKPSSFAK